MEKFNLEKDAKLSDMIKMGNNAAQFISFDPNGNIRHSAVTGRPVDDKTVSIEELISKTPHRSISIRSFKIGSTMGHPVKLNISVIEEAKSIIKENGKNGLISIAGEYMDFTDMFSGVTLGDMVEFAPNDIPRCVEKGGCDHMTLSEFNKFLSIIYDSVPEFPNYPKNIRYEWSIYRHKCGYYDRRVVIWEAKEDGGIIKPMKPSWPNKVSEHMGDKVYGIMRAQISGLGTLIPKTMVVSRNLPPFNMGVVESSNGIWTRTAPSNFSAGEHPTVFGHADTFKWLANDDEKNITSVMSQHAIKCLFSGAAEIDYEMNTKIEVKSGDGDDFMLGHSNMVEMPTKYVSRTMGVMAILFEKFGPCKVEFGVTETELFLFQLRLLIKELNDGQMGADYWVDFNPDGKTIEDLNVLIEKYSDVAFNVGINITKNVGLLSHWGDVLRNSSLPYRILGK